MSRDLNAEIAAGYHDTVRGFNDLIDILDSLCALDLGKYRDLAVVLGEQGLNFAHTSCIADEGSCDQVESVLCAPDEVISVLVCNGRKLCGDTRDVAALAL